MQVEKGSYQPSAEVQAEYSPAIKQIGTNIDTSLSKSGRESNVDYASELNSTCESVSFRVFFESPVIYQLYFRSSYSHLSPGQRVTIYIYHAGGFGWSYRCPGGGYTLELPDPQYGYQS